MTKSGATEQKFVARGLDPAGQVQENSHAPSS